MNEIIKNGLTFLSSTNIQLESPQFGSFSIHDGKKCVQLDLVDKFGLANLEIAPNLKFILIFSLFDYYIDLELLPKRCNSFKQKYLNLNIDTEDKLILQQVYRIAKTIRNCLVHNPSALTFSDSGLSVDYSHNNTSFSLQISNKGLDLFYKIIYLFLSEMYGKTEYFLSLIRSMYKDLIIEISTFNDDIEGNLATVNPHNLYISYESRDIFTNPDIEIKSNNFIIKNPPSITTHFDIIYKCNGKTFRIPSEALSCEHSISLIEMNTKWLIED